MSSILLGGIRGLQSRQATKLLHTRFNGITFNAPVESSTTHYRQYVTGVDSTTGYNFANLGTLFNAAGTEFLFEMFPDTPTSGANASARVADLTANLMRSDILTGTRMDNTNGTFMRAQVLSCASAVGVGTRPQSQFILFRKDGSGNSPAADLNQFYWRCNIKLPSNLATQLRHDITDGNWFALLELKTGGVNNNAAQGDFRIVLQIREVGGDGTLGWKVTCDNRANHPNLGGSYPVVTNWELPVSGINTSTPVPLNEWFTLEWFHHRPQSYSDTTTGRSWMALTKQDGQRYIMFDKIGGVQKGDLGCVITRLWPNIYTGGNYPIAVDYDNLQIWDNIPYDI